MKRNCTCDSKAVAVRLTSGMKKEADEASVVCAAAQKASADSSSMWMACVMTRWWRKHCAETTVRNSACAATTLSKSALSSRTAARSLLKAASITSTCR